ncbi:bifunctional hydroxymethylpyrimidine kinase/phosphomethylpyrimidine kinase [Thaumasiovibrio sp. DFM-14]|uniref:bifunctional hydroxymethylpyrimidine kinase/phosphomethylpyrimidine kinase n=1 Tax=Thaumasiovibrio sp. DFM-14 TaxID=3384792 RepID=UPI00399F5854
MSTPITLTIAGSDSGGGAGIQADIKAISATGGYACSAITALTAQNTQGVQGILPIDIAFVAQQIDAIFTDLDVKAVKIGMLADSDIIRTVAEKLKQYQPAHIVLDPVMVATSGDLLLQQDAIACLKEHLLPLATVITPNLPEAAALTGTTMPSTPGDMDNLVNALKALDTRAVLLKGGHSHDDQKATDLLIEANNITTFSVERHPTNNTHGTGCTLSAAIASYLAQQNALPQAVKLAKNYISDAIKHADELRIGKGHGPVNHFYMLNR